MILRRVLDRLKQQEWTAVAVEVAIVVLGVFLGIQVSNWNEDRKDRALEAVYLQRIAAELSSAFAADRELLATSQNYWLYTNRHIRLMRELQQQATALADDIERREHLQGSAP